MSRLDEEEDDEKKQIHLPEPQPSPVQKALFKSRTVLIFGDVDMKMAERVCAQLLALAAEGTVPSLARFMFVPVIVCFLILAPVTAPFLICLVPTLFLGSVVAA